MSKLLNVANVSKSFGGIRAVTNVSFSAHAGEFIGLIGPNGAGKTTLFNTISGSIAPTNGSIRLGNTEIAGLAPSRIAHLGVARTYQLVKLFNSMTVIENVMMGIWAQTRSRRASALRARTNGVCRQ